ncbi:LexA family protein [Sutterella wadsworthensis]
MRAACGFPSPAADYESEDIDLSAWLVRKPNSTFIVEASGDSMIDAGISDGDMLIFDRDAQPRGGDIVLALYDGNITVKRLRIVDGRPELHPENAAARYKVICPKSTEQFEIEGVLRGLCRRYS